MKPRDADTRLQSARAMLRAGRADKAESLVRRMLHYRPDDPAALHLAGLIARSRGRIVRAVQLLEKAAAADPAAPDVWCDYGLALKAAGRAEEAVAAQRRVVEMVPGSALALANLGSACVAAGAHGEALEHLGRAEALAPENAEIRYNLGNAHLHAGDWPAAEAALTRALDADPRHGRAAINLATARKEQGRLAEAVETLRHACMLLPGDADAEWNLGLSLLMAGEWAEGWARYEARRRLAGFAIRGVRKAPWDGSALAGRRLLVHAEQGLGDTIQFCRYLPLLGDAGGEIVFLCPAPLIPLLGTLDANIEIAGADGKTPRYDVEAPLMSLPHLLGRPVPECGEAYLSAEPDRIARWRGTAAADGALTVAVAWQGNPDYPADARRSIPPAQLAPLAGIAGVRLVSIQKGGAAEPAGPGGRVRRPGPGFDEDGAFLDSAAILQTADLLVTSDSAVAHLGGALGVETWLALARVPDWRWGMEGETTPWYPSLRLFRQQTPGDWDGVFARIAAALRQRTA